MIRADRSTEQILQTLRCGGDVEDEDFDAYLPPGPRLASRQYWTPVAVATLATQWLVRTGARRVLDVGSGCGKVCVVGAIVSELSFVGLEQRLNLVRIARKLAHRFGVEERATFRHGTLADVPFEEFDALYFYNPFGENVFAEEEHLDTSVALTPERFQDDIRQMESVLERMPVGSRVITYHGFGGRIPDMYELTCSDRTRTGTLRLWTRTRDDGLGSYWVERENTAAFRDAQDQEALSAAKRPIDAVKDAVGVLAEKYAYGAKYQG
ncbi:class I SAM-dependent methyltransferase [Pendulispora rubella]|uniref:Class I SAM-dependent methyltransferase n=1 Tax=Pendulispora rubella TaxID=2741070 RepID=A0ABZ2KS75_9BACT